MPGLGPAGKLQDLKEHDAKETLDLLWDLPPNNTPHDLLWSPQTLVFLRIYLYYITFSPLIVCCAHKWAQHINRFTSQNRKGRYGVRSHLSQVGVDPSWEVKPGHHGWWLHFTSLLFMFLINKSICPQNLAVGGFQGKPKFNIFLSPFLMHELCRAAGE